MKKLRIAYEPFSNDLSHPGDRRRVAFWAERRGHTLTTNLSEKADVIILSERADFGAFALKAPGTPIILDLIDGYLADLPSPMPSHMESELFKSGRGGRR